MKISKKTILMLGVVFGLVFFPSGFCTQASAGQGMPGMAMGSTAAHSLSIESMVAQGMDVVVVSQDTSHAIDTCIFECATKTPQVALSEKTKISNHVVHLSPFDFSSVDLSPQEALIRGIDSGESPGDISSADILLSVQKRE